MFFLYQRQYLMEASLRRNPFIGWLEWHQEDSITNIVREIKH
jgi:1-acyl-sn-glycerol-3-phosphate acyltransferase